MAKKYDSKSDIISQENNESEGVKDMIKDVIEDIETVKEEVTYGFDQAYRLFLKEFPQAKLWTIEAVQVFCKKRIEGLETSLDKWFDVLKSY